MTIWDEKERRSMRGFNGSLGLVLQEGINYQRILQSLLSCQSAMNFTSGEGI